MEKTILTVSEAADLLRVSRGTVYRLLKSGKLPGFRIGSDWRFLMASLNDWMRGAEKAAA